MRRFVCTLSTLFLGSLTAGCAARGDPPPRIVPQAIASDRAADLCAGLPADERERPYFLRRDGIESVKRIGAEAPAPQREPAEPPGAEIVLRPSATVTKHWVARVLRCHLADPIALALRESFDDLLVVGSPDISLAEATERIVVRIVGRDVALGDEIVRRAEELPAD